MRRAMRQAVAAAMGLAASLGMAQGAAPMGKAQVGGASSMPRLVQEDGRWALMVDGAPYLMLGVQVNNSSAWPGVLPEVWPAVERLHANTVEAPVYWEQMEAEQGRFDFSVVDTLLAGARQHKVRLVLLWFGTWKNGSPHYVPEWMKRDEVGYPRVVDDKGAARDTMSPFAATTLAADTAAFAALMRHLKVADTRQTVIMVQVENEINAYGSARDYSTEGKKLFDGPVPPALATALHMAPGTWTEVFGLPSMSNRWRQRARRSMRCRFI
jgi:beta-galactosidase GanA